MLVFIDESADPGFRVDKGATPIFVVAMAIFANGDDARNTEQVIRETQATLNAYPEFKFSKSSDRIRDSFFRAVRPCSFTVRAIVVEKRLIYSPRLKSDKDKFYEFFVRQMMAHDNERLRNANIVIDGSGDREFRQNMKTYLRQHV